MPVADTSVIIALLSIFAAIVTSTFAMTTYSNKKANEAKDQAVLAKDEVIDVLQTMIVTVQEEKKALIIDNKEQATVIGKLGQSVDKLTDQGQQSLKLLEDIVYGRPKTPQPRRTT